jgi:hypothetical protein
MVMSLLGLCVWQLIELSLRRRDRGLVFDYSTFSAVVRDGPKWDSMPESVGCVRLLLCSIRK